MKGARFKRRTLRPNAPEKRTMDLHMHSHYSDGELSPESLVKNASEAGVHTIALTDHDTIRGYEQAHRAGVELGVEVIPGVEFTCREAHRELHLLAYLWDMENTDFNNLLSAYSEFRESRIRAIIEKLAVQGLDLEYSEIRSQFPTSTLGRPHIAKILVQKGLTSSIESAFRKILSHKNLSPLPVVGFSAKEVIEIILSAGGIPVLAHPQKMNCDPQIPALVSHGLLGMETYVPGASKFALKKYRQMANLYGLLPTGGSDFHSESTGQVGKPKVPQRLLNGLKEKQKQLSLAN